MKYMQWRYKYQNQEKLEGFNKNRRRNWDRTFSSPSACAGCCRLLLGKGQDAVEDFDRALSLLGVPERLQNTDVPCTRMHSK